MHKNEILRGIGGLNTKRTHSFHKGPNNVNLGNGRAVYAAVSHVDNNQLRFNVFGTMMALRDGTAKAIIDATNPYLASTEDGGKRVVVPKSGTYTPRIMLNFIPATSGGSRTTRQKSGQDAIGTNGVTGMTASVETEIVYNGFREFEIRETLFTSDAYREEAALEYMDKLVGDQVDVSELEDSKFNRVKKALGQTGMTILTRINKDLLTPVNNDLITRVAAGVGKNAAYPDWDGVGGTEDAPIISVFAFGIDGYTPDPAFMEAIEATALANRYTSRPIMVGGNKLASYMRKIKVVSLADTGFRLDALVMLPLLWYYDSKIDEIYGQDQVLMWDNAACCLQTWQEHSDYGLVQTGRHGLMYYGNLTLRIAQYNGIGLENPENPASFPLEIDFRVLESTDAADYPQNSITPSMRYGVYKRPVGFFESDEDDIMYSVTGIFAFKLETRFV